MSALRPYQLDAREGILSAWGGGARNVLAVLPTGAGKTVLFGNIILNNGGASVAIAHRSELVSQMSLALARNGIRHKVIGSPATAAACRSAHLSELGRNYVEPSSRVAVASVDTLIRRDANDPWFREVTLWVTDEAHHLLRTNKWGVAVRMFPNARGLGVTATPTRADGRGLGVHADGVMHEMIVGPSMRQLMNEGYLTDYRIFAPPSDIDLAAVPVSSSGDYSPPKLAAAVHKSRIVGDVVEHYLKLAFGRQGVTFAVDVESATEIAAAFKKSGVPAEVVSAKTPEALRADVVRRFKRREIQQLVNVDLFGEGFDLPAVEVVSMARPTQSYSLFVQQFGRALRLSEGKSRAIIIDHVSNTMRHGLPDAPRSWSLDARERRSRATPDDVVPVRACASCLAAYERAYPACPYCGTASVPVTRSTADAVDGDLCEMSPDLLARLRGEADPAIKIPYGAPPEVVGAVKKRFRERQAAQESLRGVMALWGGWQASLGRGDSEQQRRFFHAYGVDALSAQGLARTEAAELEGRILQTLIKNKISVDEVVN